MSQQDKSILRLEKRLKSIESKLEQVGRQLEESGKQSYVAFGMGIGFAGLATALALAVTSPDWSGRELHPWQLSFLLTGISLAVVYWSLLRYAGDYRKAMGIIATLFMILGPIVFIISDIWRLDIPWVKVGSMLSFAVGAGMLPLSRKRRKQREW